MMNTLVSPCKNLFIDIESDVLKYTMSLYHHPIETMIFYLYKAYMKRSSEITTRGRPRTSNTPHVTEIGGDIDNGTTAPYI